MWSHEDLFDIFRGNFPYYLLIAFPILLILSPMPVSGSVEFPVFRLQQFELHGSTYGSQSSLVNVEARTLDSGSYARRCVLVRIKDLTPSLYHQLVNQGAAALLILLPKSLNSLSLEHKELIWELEEVLIDTEVQMAVYLAYESAELTDIYDSVRTFTNTDSASSAAAALLSSLSSDGYQMVVGGSQSKKISDSFIANIHGRLAGYGVEEQLPTIAIVAHYDAFAAAPELAFGADSNGSGVVALLEIARILSKLYSSVRTHPQKNILFLLSGGGFFNYQGSKRFLEDQLDASDSPLLSEIEFALCLDTLTNGSSLNFHASRKPKENTPPFQFYTALEEAGKQLGVNIEMIHKKINLKEDLQSWEHEKYSMRKITAFTLSRLSNPKTGERGSLTDTFEVLNATVLKERVAVIVAGLLKYIYNRPVDDLLAGGLSVTEDSINSWLSLLKSQPRSTQMLSGKNNPFISSLHQILSRYASEVKTALNKADRRDPEWVFYDNWRSSMTAYAVKPASFDFVLTLVIAAYLSVVYLFLQYFPRLFSFLYKLTATQRLKIN
ncbi:Nicalin-1 [Armadillidium nasatum]|uniref:BOS complex subunit NCLN n=1 Tax=Armadillidium nasatum TaxID=96803 RepID=A0A5N5T5H4_9CRUS|nr:Nicalin-1 [Armadillidium nasatum]